MKYFKLLSRTLYIVGILSFLSGCMSNNPMARNVKELGLRADYKSLGLLLGGTAVGAALGNALEDNTEDTAIGAAVGLATGAVLAYITDGEQPMVKSKTKTYRFRTQSDVIFAFNKSTLSTKASQSLSDLIDLIRTKTKDTDIDKLNIKVVGHTDTSGAESYNKTLSKKRANSVASFLMKNNLSKEGITTYGLGEARPIADNATRDGRKKNRRVEIFVTTTEHSS